MKNQETEAGGPPPPPSPSRGLALLTNASTVIMALDWPEALTTTSYFVQADQESRNRL